jgi:hypothetical protein
MQSWNLSIIIGEKSEMFQECINPKNNWLRRNHQKRKSREQRENKSE